MAGLCHGQTLLPLTSSKHMRTRVSRLDNGGLLAIGEWSTTGPGASEPSSATFLIQGP